MPKVGNVVDAETASKIAHSFGNEFRAVIWPENMCPLKISEGKLSLPEITGRPKRRLVHAICLKDRIALFVGCPIIFSDQSYGLIAFIGYTSYDKTNCISDGKVLQKTAILDNPRNAINDPRFSKLKVIPWDSIASSIDALPDDLVEHAGALLSLSALELFAFSPIATTKLRPSHRHMGNPRKYPLKFEAIEIIHLRMPEIKDHPESTGRTINLRFPVKPHIRNQWYPSLGIHKPIQIAEHWRGPEDASIKPKTEKVYKVTR